MHRLLKLLFEFFMVNGPKWRPRIYFQEKKHSENADNSTSATFNLDVRLWPFVKVKKAIVIRCRLLYCTLLPGIMSVRKSLLDMTISWICVSIWPSLETFNCDLHCLSFTLIIRYMSCCCLLYQEWSLYVK